MAGFDEVLSNNNKFHSHKATAVTSYRIKDTGYIEGNKHLATLNTYSTTLCFLWLQWKSTTTITKDN